MAMETLSSNELFNFITCSEPISNTFFLENPHNRPEEEYLVGDVIDQSCTAMTPPPPAPQRGSPEHRQSAAAVAQGRRKRRRRAKSCKNKEEAESQRMTHIAVERNRRKQMNEHLAILRSLMPPSYAQRGDQASIVGGAIEFVKELEHLLQSLEAQKFLTFQQSAVRDSTTETATTFFPAPFSQFFGYPQYACSHIPNKYTSKSNADVAEIEVTLIETHANIRILSRRRLRQLSKLVAGFHNFCLTILHLNLNTLDPLVLYSISAKVEEGCQLNTADEIAGAVHHMLRIIEEEALPYVDSTLPSPFNA
ncbi:hypothetical protein LguiA_015342 [Lonicera macranthoides]